jgi:hypothetical protein
MSTYTPYGQQIKMSLGELPATWGLDPGLNANRDQVSNLIKLGAGIVSVSTLAPTYVSGTTFTVLGDRTAEFVQFRKLYVVQSASTWVEVVSSSYSGGTGKTTVTIGTSTLINAALTVYLSLSAPSALATHMHTALAMIFSGNCTALNTGATAYLVQPAGGTSGSDDIASNTRIMVTRAGTVKNFYVALSAAPGAGKTWVFTIRKNGSNQSVTITINNPATTGSDTANSFTVAASESLSIEQVPSGTPAGSELVWGFSLE